MKKYTEVTDEALITLEASRNGFVQGAYWLLLAAISLIAQDIAIPDRVPLNLVIRERPTGRVAYKKGPLLGSNAVWEAEEAARVVRALGIKGYLAREQQ